ncbi:MAG TPA: D-aminoacyl-tRNA deacylase [Patescibacteria group bacterium]|nr:D-aminoacyl-tRNA deacylase [Patescibacteria group bacterium]
MIAVLQRVSRAEVRIGGAVVGRIGRGLVVLLAIERGDDSTRLDGFSDKVLQVRVFDDNTGRMNLSARDVGAGLLVVSQFTLAADLSRGRRPGFEGAARPGVAEPLYEGFVARLRTSGLTVETGRFREHMEVELVNDGPVTFVLRDQPR